jgi:hypothetical protein
MALPQAAPASTSASSRKSLDDTGRRALRGLRAAKLRILSLGEKSGLTFRPLAAERRRSCEVVPVVKVFTIGHSTRSVEAFIGLLEMAGIGCLADVRRFPFSRRHPHFNGERLAESLAAAGIAYRHFPALGGRRGPPPKGREPANTLWREEAFRNYADYAQTAEFRAALAALMALAHARPTAIMCAEAVWWRCHRRIIADYLIAAGFAVEHILDGKIEPARLTPGAMVQSDGGVLYAAQRLL